MFMSWKPIGHCSVQPQNHTIRCTTCIYALILRTELYCRDRFRSHTVHNHYRNVRYDCKIMAYPLYYYVWPLTITQNGVTPH